MKNPPLARLPWQKIFPPLILIVTGGLLYPSAGRDDAYIHYWQAYALEQYGQFVNYNGELLEQTSSLTHTLLLVLGQLLMPISYPVLGILISVLFGCLSCFLIIPVTRRLVPDYADWAPFLLATTLPFVYWSFSGMEMTLYSFLTLGSVLLMNRILNPDSNGRQYDLLGFGAFLPVYLLVRPESFAVLASVLLGLLICYGLRKIRFPGTALYRPGLLSSVGLGAILAVGGLRHAYFGHYLPHAVRTKVYFKPELPWKTGFWYLWNHLTGPGLSILIPLALFGGVIALGKFFSDENPGTLGVLLVLHTVALLGFILMVGGDWMEAGRFVVPLLPVVIPLALLGVERLPLARHWTHGLLLLMVLLLLTGTVTFPRKKSKSLPLWAWGDSTGAPRTDEFGWTVRLNKPNRQDIRVYRALRRVIHRLRDRGVKEITVLSDQGGFIPFSLMKEFYGDVTWVDRRGLVSTALIRCEFIRNSTVKSSRYGLKLSWENYFQNARAINNYCLSGPPELIHIRDRFSRLTIRSLTAAGYFLVHGDYPRFVPDPKRGKNRFEGNYLSVRKDLYDPHIFPTQIRVPVFNNAGSFQKTMPIRYR